jgi:hypothetical protein
MTEQQQSLIVPSKALVESWVELLHFNSDQEVFNLAVKWGSDEELEACCNLLDEVNAGKYWSTVLKSGRRPLLNIKQQALLILEDIPNIDSAHYNILLKALESLPDD